jgi:hypothetical protein
MRAFDCSRCAAQSALANGLNPPKSRGAHLVVNAESDANLLAWIQEQAEKYAAVARTDIKNYCREVWMFEASRGCVDSFISRHGAELTNRKVHHEKSRVCKFHESSSKKRYAICVKYSRVIQLTWRLILMKLGYPTGRIENRRESWFQSPSALATFAIEYLGT